MKIVKVTYTVKPDFVETNKRNIEAFIRDIKNPSTRYISLLGADGKTFTHIAMYDNDEAQQQFLELSSFKSFQEQRNSIGLEKPEHIEMIDLVASSYDIFKPS